MTVECIGCLEQIYPVIQLALQGGTKRYTCPACHCALPPTILDSRTPQAEVIALRPAPQPATLPGTTAVAPLDPEAQIRARLEWIDARLAEVEPLREEQAKLRRMLDAAAPPSAKRATG